MILGRKKKYNERDEKEVHIDKKKKKWNGVADREEAAVK